MSEAGTKKSKRGAPKGSGSKYRRDMIKKAEVVVRLGGTDVEIAAVLDVSVQTLQMWKKEHPEFALSLKETKEQQDQNVVTSLYKRAVGYSHEDVDIRTRSIGDGCSEIVKTPYIKHYPPDATSCIFWLKNRQRDKWRDRHELTGADGAPVNDAKFDPKKLSLEELLALKEMLEKGKPDGGP